MELLLVPAIQKSSYLSESKGTVHAMKSSSSENEYLSMVPASSASGESQSDSDSLPRGPTKALSRPGIPLFLSVNIQNHHKMNYSYL